MEFFSLPLNGWINVCLCITNWVISFNGFLPIEVCKFHKSEMVKCANSFVSFVFQELKQRNFNFKEWFMFLFIHYVWKNQSLAIVFVVKVEAFINKACFFFLVFYRNSVKMAAATPGQPQFMTSPEKRSPANEPLIDNIDYDQIVVPDVSISFSFFTLVDCCRPYSW